MQWNNRENTWQIQLVNRSNPVGQAESVKKHHSKHYDEILSPNVISMQRKSSPIAQG